MAILTVGKAMRGLVKTPALLLYLLGDVTQEQAQNSWDGEWNVVYVMCHLRDLEAAFVERLETMLVEDNPMFKSNDLEQMVVENNYAGADLREALAEFEVLRRRFISILHGLTPEQWERRGQHPVFGETTVLTLAINSSNHDLDHIEQITRALGKTQVWS